MKKKQFNYETIINITAKLIKRKKLEILKIEKKKYMTRKIVY